MKIMQIGELAGGLSDGFKDRTTEQIQWGMIRGMRNLFAHTYAKNGQENHLGCGDPGHSKAIEFL